MEDNKYMKPSKAGSPVLQLFLSFVVILFPGTVVFLILMLTGSAAFNTGLSVLSGHLLNTVPGESGFIRFALAVQELSYFILPSLFILLSIRPRGEREVLGTRGLVLSDLLLLIALVLFMIPLAFYTGELNSRMVLPQWLSGVEDWMKSREAYANDLISQVLSTGSVHILVVNILVVAVLPAIGEELLFRGILQRLFNEIFRSGNAAVWFTAFLFSAVHLQFYGFLPRFLLGLVLGYLFLFSGSVWLPAAVHFVNNALGVLMVFGGVSALPGSKSGLFSPDSPAVVLLSLVAVPAILILFRRRRCHPPCQ
jgi:uncharacterized protein